MERKKLVRVPEKIIDWTLRGFIKNVGKASLDRFNDELALLFDDDSIYRNPNKRVFKYRIRLVNPENPGQILDIKYVDKDTLATMGLGVNMGVLLKTVDKASSSASDLPQFALFGPLHQLVSPYSNSQGLTIGLLDQEELLAKEPEIINAISSWPQEQRPAKK